LPEEADLFQKYKSNPLGIYRDHRKYSQIVDEGISGLLFDTIDQAVEAVRKIGQIERKGVRRAFERRFTVEKMANAYEEIYQKIIH
jgi:glycosyltransferase involved in cell wall biosynthesis